MAAIIPIQVADQTKPGFDSINQNIDKTEANAKTASESLKGMTSKDIVFSPEAIKRAQDWAAGLNKTADATRKATKESEAHGRSIVGTSKDMFKALFSMELLKQGIQRATQGIATLSQEYNPAARRIVEAQNRMTEAAKKTFEHPFFQRVGNLIADQIENYAVPAVGNLGSGLDSLTNKVTRFGLSSLEYFGLVAKGSTDTFDSMRKDQAKQDEEEKKRIERQKQLLKAQDQLKEVGKALAEAEKAQAGIRQERELAQIADLKKIQTMYAEVTAAIQAQAKEGEASAEDIAKAQDRLIALVNRYKEIQEEALHKEIERREKLKQEKEKLIEEEKRLEEERHRAQVRLWEEEERKRKELLEKQRQAYEDFIERVVNKLKPAGNALDDFFAKMAGGGGKPGGGQPAAPGGQGPAEGGAGRPQGLRLRFGIGGGIGIRWQNQFRQMQQEEKKEFDQAAEQTGQANRFKQWLDGLNKKALERVAQKRGDEAAGELDRAIAFRRRELQAQLRAIEKDLEAQFNREIAGGADRGEAMGRWKEKQKEQQGNLKEDAKREEQQLKNRAQREREDARREVFRQAKKGQIAPEEMGAAVKDVAGEQIKNAQGQGKLNQQQADVLQKMTETLTGQNKELETVQADLKRIQAFLDGLDKSNQRRQAVRRQGR